MTGDADNQGNGGLIRQSAARGFCDQVMRDVFLQWFGSGVLRAVFIEIGHGQAVNIAGYEVVYSSLSAG